VNTDTIEIIAISRRRELQDEFEILDLDRLNWVIQYSDSITKLNKIYFVDENTGWVIGDRGLILYTSNGGANWLKQESRTVEKLNAIYFVNSNTGYITTGYIDCSGSILKTSDGGNTWNSFVIDSNRYCFRDIYFKNENTGLVSGFSFTITDESFGLNWFIFKTTDTCSSWETQYIGNDMYSIQPVIKEFFPVFNNFDKIMYNLSNDVLYKSTDSGITWYYLYPPGLRDIFFVNPEIGYAISAKGMYILKTTTGGE